MDQLVLSYFMGGDATMPALPPRGADGHRPRHRGDIGRSERPRCNMQEHRVEARVSSDGSLTLKELPFQAGDEVEVIIRGCGHREDEGKHYPLSGEPIRYTDPFGSVAEEDWEALR